MKIIIIALIILNFCNCTNRNNNFKKGIEINKDSIAKLDSLKWSYYSMNYDGTVVFYDSTKDIKITQDAVLSTVVLKWHNKISADSTVYLFSFYKPGCAFVSLKNIVGVDGFSVYNGIISPIINHAKFDFENNKDSIVAFMQRFDGMFKLYLKNYKGNIAPWLKEEAVKRNILQ